MMTVRVRLKEIAESKGLNMSQIQRRSGLTMMQIRRYWHNKGKHGALEQVSLPAIGALSRVLEVEPGELLGRENTVETS
jgi:transcriptional regulator with XRE-family HTH domain